MTIHYFVKSMLSGMAFPSVFLPLAYTLMYCYDSALIQAHPLQFIPLYVPILFGITNVIHLSIGERCPIKDSNTALWVTGACLGIIVAIFGVFVLEVPTVVFGFSHGFQYLPLILLPIVYGAIFRYIVKWLNDALGI